MHPPSNQFGQIIRWLSAPDPWTNHETARRHHQAQTGRLLLESDVYKRWKNGGTKHLWLSGKAGCGKTILCSTIVEDIYGHSGSTQNMGLAVFYFSFTDNRKQSARDLLLSLAAQLCWKEPVLSALQHAYGKAERSVPRNDELERIVLSSISSCDRVYAMFDALDEIPEADDARQDVLDLMDRLAQCAPRLKIFATSREVRNIAEPMDVLGADTLATNTRAVDNDIRMYVSKQLSGDRRLSRWDVAVRDEVEHTLASKANGM